MPCTRPTALLAGLGLALAAAIYARLPHRPLTHRLLSLNAVLLSLVLLLPLSLEGGTWSPGWSQAGFGQALRIALRANAIFLMMSTLLSTLEPVRLGHALHLLGVSDKLVQLLVFTLRYMDLLDEERQRLLSALRVRGFRPRLDRRTLRTYGHALGMLLVRAFDRSERILGAMHCRGFEGRFHLLHDLRMGAADVRFALASGTALMGLGWLAWH